jgi:hypothetical protein
MARLYANENFPRPVVERLHSLGHDVLTTDDEGQSGQRIPDDLVLRFAMDEARAVLTLNRTDFIRLHRQDSHHAGIIVCKTFDPDEFDWQSTLIHGAIAAESTLDGKLIRIIRGTSIAPP